MTDGGSIWSGSFGLVVKFSDTSPNKLHPIKLCARTRNRYDIPGAKLIAFQASPIHCIDNDCHTCISSNVRVSVVSNGSIVICIICTSYRSTGSPFKISGGGHSTSIFQIPTLFNVGIPGGSVMSCFVSIHWLSALPSYDAQPCSWNARIRKRYSLAGNKFSHVHSAPRIALDTVAHMCAILFSWYCISYFKAPVCAVHATVIENLVLRTK